MNKVKFIKLTDWTLIPIKEKLLAPETNENTDIRWIRNQRVKGKCWPYRMAVEIGWTILSPIDVEIHPVNEMQVAAENHEDLEELQKLMGIDFWVQRDQILLGVKPDGWFRIHQAKVNDYWQCMFIPNGQGSFEWKLGWGIEIPEDFFLMFQPLEDQQDFIVHPGLLPAHRLSSFNAGLGLPIAIEPKKIKKIKKGDPLAKLLVIHKSAMNLKEEIEECNSNQTGQM